MSAKMTHIDIHTDQVLWQQLSEINSALELLNDSHATKVLEGLRDSTRTLLDDRARSKLRPLILGMPNELLMQIFEHMNEDTYTDGQYYYGHITHTTIADIKNLRLTCRRFYEIGSYFLLPCVEVDITRSSLARLDKVSRHPYISKGVRAVKLYLEPFYGQTIAHDIQAFATYHASRLRRAVLNWDFWSIFHPSGPATIEDTLSSDEYMRRIRKGIHLAESWEKLAAQGVDTNCADHLLMLKAHKQYLQLYEDYEDISSSFIQAIISAIMRMPNATWVKVNEKGIFDLDDEPWNSPLRLKCLEHTDALLDYLLLPINWCDERDHKLVPPPFHLVGELLLSIQQLGIPLRKLNIQTPPPIVPSSSVATIQHQAVFLKNLKAVRFGRDWDFRKNYYTKRAPEEWACITDFLLNLLHTKSLRKIGLAFSFMLKNIHPPLLSMAPLLLSYTWPNLEDLYFDGPFHSDELKAVAKSLGRNVKLQWSGYLMSDSWEDVLDFLQERNAPRQQVGNTSPFGSVDGQECNRMAVKEKGFIFSVVVGPSRATQYIQGQLPRNPVRDWTMGRLDIPESEEDDW